MEIYSKNINFTRKAFFEVKDSLGIEVLSDLKYKESKRVRRNEIKVKITKEDVSKLFKHLETESEISYDSFSTPCFDVDSVELLLKFTYFK